MAEAYGIYDYKSLSVSTVVSLFRGLRADSRIVTAVNGRKLPFSTELNMAISDKLDLLLWTKTKDAQKGRNKPKGILATLYAEDKKRDETVFDSPEDFKAARDKILGEINGK